MMYFFFTQLFLDRSPVRARTIVLGNLVILCLTHTVPGHAQKIAINPFVSTGITHDDNVFRVSSGEEATKRLGSPKRSDQVYQVEAGFESISKISRQEIEFNARINTNKFDEFSFLDYTGGHARIAGNLRAGSIWSGNIGYDYDRSLSLFDSFRRSERDLRTLQQLFGNVTRQLTPRWQANLGLSTRDVSFDNRDDVERKIHTLNSSALYTTLAGNIVGAEIIFRDGEFPNRDVDFSRAIDNAYTELEVNVLANWKLSGRSKILAKLGITDRDQDNISSRNFDGVTGRLTHEWDISRKTSLATSIWREVSALNDEISNFVVTKGIGLEGAWQATRKISVLPYISFEERDFQQNFEPDTVTDITNRKDELKLAGVAVTYQPKRRLSFSIVYSYGRKDSNNPLSEYRFHSISGNAKYSF